MAPDPFKLERRGEGSIKRYLVRACWRSDARFCIRCKTKKVYRIRRDRYRCSQCGYEFSDFAGRWINKAKLPPRYWFWLIRLFELGVSARKASQQSGVSYPTVHKAFHLIRQSIAAHCGNADSLLDREGKEVYAENRCEGRCAEGSKAGIPVFGILEKKGFVSVEPLQNLSAEAVLNLGLDAGREGSVIYTDRWGNYDALIFSDNKHFTGDGWNKLSGNRVHINGSKGFWSYTKERMNKFHGISDQNFPFYLKEMEFRYNHRHESIFNTLVLYLCDLTEVWGEGRGPNGNGDDISD